VVQRVRRADVAVAGAQVGAIDGGLLVLIGIAPGDGPDQVAWMARKLATLRIFEDDDGRMNRSLLDTGGGALVVSQFTLYGDCRKGRRPSFVGAAHPDVAAPLYEALATALETQGVSRVARGQFGATMTVHLVNDGPVTLVIDAP